MMKIARRFQYLARYSAASSTALSIGGKPRVISASRSVHYSSSVCYHHFFKHHPAGITTLATSSPRQASSLSASSSSASVLPSSTNASSRIQTMSSSAYWNREESTPKAYNLDAPIVQEARIISLSDPNDVSNDRLHTGELPEGSELLQIGTKLDDFDIETLKQQEPNVLFVSHPKSRVPLVELIEALPSIRWVHARSAGLDFIASDGLARVFATASSSTPPTLRVTNAKGHFSSTLAEYTMMAASYFAKDLPRLLKQQKASNWERYCILELRGATMGIIGYGDIGRAAAKLATAYGMKVIALRRNPNSDDPYCGVVYGSSKENMNRIFAESDYVLCAAPLTKETKGMIGKEQFDSAKKDVVFINVGRGAIVDEDSMIDALKDGRLKGAGLDVFATEPLPADSELWKLDNVLISPHNMDATETFMQEATEFFVEENLPRFLRGEELLNPVDAAAGY